MLTILMILIPFVFSLVVFFLKDKGLIRNISLGASLISLGLVIYGALIYDKNLDYNFYYIGTWISSVGVNFEFALDGVGFLLVFLVSFLMPLIILSSFTTNYSGSGNFYGLILIMQSALIGVFSSFDGLLFYIFWEMALVPIYFIVLAWGGENRIQITLKFFIYTLASSLFMLLAIIYLYTLTPDPHSFSLSEIYKLSLSESQQYWIFGAFLLAFAVKIPIFPFHTWQPDTYNVAPSPGSMLLSGLMPKMGLFGILRFIIPLCPMALGQFGIYVIILAITGLLYGALIAIRQNELKRLIAFSSLSHVGLMAAAIFTLNNRAISGSVIQMLSHGINVFGMFFIADIILIRMKTTQISELGGIAKSAPKLAIFFMIVMLANVALPITNGFIGEFLMLGGLFSYNKILAAIAGLSIIFGAVYMFWLYQKAIFGYPNEKTQAFEDLNKTELSIAIIIVIAIYTVGLYPTLLTSFSDSAIQHLTNY
jgi:NADH-quinone oxidoreductase subunit M